MTLSFDQAQMERYMPLLKIPSSMPEDERPTGWFGWIATSPEYTFDVYVFVLEFPTQRGHTRFDSHKRDREPVLVYVSPDYREVREAVYSAWHWQAEHVKSPETWKPESGDGEHIQLSTHRKHHHFTQTEDLGELLSVEALGTSETLFDGPPSQTVFESWLDTGWEESLEPGVLQNPQRMRSRQHFWREGRETWSVRLWSVLQLQLARAGLKSGRLGSADAATSDLV